MNVRSALYLQAIRGPILLMTVGILFAIHQADVISFARTWPLLIIVIGVMKLLERALAPVAAPQYPNYAGSRQAGGPVPPGPQTGGPQR